MEKKMKRNATSKPFSEEEKAAAIAAAPDAVVFDPENPPTRSEEWAGAIVSHSLAQLREKLSARRQRGPGKSPKKMPTTVRFSPGVLSAFRATGKGWQTRMDAALADWLKNNSPEELTG
jgi:uncharacterized protein (DUF4415 family)